jgi:hypothetical protein
MKTRKHRGGADAPPAWLLNSVDNIQKKKTVPTIPGPTSANFDKIEHYFIKKGGYTATARNKYYLKKYRRGNSIGFTMKASLKAKGLLPRTSKNMRGKKMVSAKYR